VVRRHHRQAGLEAYYQFAWNSFKFDPAGTFFSTADVIGKGNRVAYMPTSICNDFGLPRPAATAPASPISR
jgi:hypothetical protein